MVHKLKTQLMRGVVTGKDVTAAWRRWLRGQPAAGGGGLGGHGFKPRPLLQPDNFQSLPCDLTLFTCSPIL